VGAQDGAPPLSAWNTYIYVEIADDTAEKAARAGGAVVVEPFDALPAGRSAVLTDPSRASFRLWEARDRPGAQIVNEPRAWSLSSLNTSEPETAKSFCGEVFNWEYDTFQAGQSEITLCRVPGYVGGEPEQPVPRDVVAVRTPMGGDAGPARHVRSGASSFWVDDVDGSAAKAAELGGWVVVSPFDTPTSRDAVLADPQGAVFSVSKAG
jgi:predicted enzyme related to lactoylglutathione lyase